MIDEAARCAHHELEAHLRPFVARRVSSPADVDDVLQDVFLRMHKSVGGLRVEDRFGPWIYRVARSAIAEHRRARRRHPMTDREAPELVAPPPDEPEDGAAEQRIASYVAPFVGMLPSPYREALTLTELEGLTQRDAAAMLGISATALKSRAQRGRAQLRALFEACCEIALDPRGRVVDCTPRPRNPAECDCSKPARLARE